MSISEINGSKFLNQYLYHVLSIGACLLEIRLVSIALFWTLIPPENLKEKEALGCSVIELRCRIGWCPPPRHQCSQRCLAVRKADSKNSRIECAPLQTNGKLGCRERGGSSWHWMASVFSETWLFLMDWKDENTNGNTKMKTNKNSPFKKKREFFNGFL